MAAEITIFYP